LLDDRADRREYLIAQSDRQLFTLHGSAEAWTEHPHGYAWIGSDESRAAVRPFQSLDWPEVPGLERVIEESWALIRGQPAFAGASSEVGGIAVSAYLQGGRFRFAQPVTIGTAPPRIRTQGDLFAALMEDAPPFSHHIHHDGEYPGRLRICIGSEAAVTYTPTVDGYAGRAYLSAANELAVEDC